MRHRKASIKLNRNSSHRKAMFRNMVTSLLKYESIKTTDAKAKEISRWADHVITLAKKGDLHSRRQALSIVQEKKVVHKLFENANEKFGDRAGGYTRIIKIGHRPGDAASMSLIELIAKEKKKEKPAKKKAAVKKDDKKKETKETEKTSAAPEKEKKVTAKMKKEDEPKKKKAAKKKSETEIVETDEKPKKKSTDTKAKKKAVAKKKAAPAKKKSTPKKTKEKKEK